MDRLIALVALRFRLDLRGILGARERLVGLVLLLPTLALGSAAASFFVFVGARARGPRPSGVARSPCSRRWPRSSALFWALSPLLAGVSFSETHDMSRLLHFPVPLPTLVVSSLLANLLEPLVLAKLPPLLALSFALAGLSPRLPLAFWACVLGFVFTLVAAQVAGLFLLGLARNRRWHDRALFLGLGLGFALSLLPLVLTSVGGGFCADASPSPCEHDLFLASPFGWGVRAAAHAGRGEFVPFVVFASASVAGHAASSPVRPRCSTRRIYRGELDLGGSGAGGPPAGARMVLPGPLGALLEKDLRSCGATPRLKAMLFTGLVGPVLLFFFVSQGGRRRDARPSSSCSPPSSGIGDVRRERVRPRAPRPAAPGRLPVRALADAGGQEPGSDTAPPARAPRCSRAVSLFLAPAALVPAVVTISAVTHAPLLRRDNFVSVLFPVPVPRRGRTPYCGRGHAAWARPSLLPSLLLGRCSSPRRSCSSPPCPGSCDQPAARLRRPAPLAGGCGVRLRDAGRRGRPRSSSGASPSCSRKRWWRSEAPARGGGRRPGSRRRLAGPRSHAAPATA